MFLLRFIWFWIVWTFTRLRGFYLNIVTLGAWDALGNYTLDIADHLADEIEKREHLEYRLDGFMRYLEQQLYLVIPTELEPPRLTTFGEGLSIEREGELVAAHLEEIKREQEKRPDVVPDPLGLSPAAIPLPDEKDSSG